MIWQIEWDKISVYQGIFVPYVKIYKNSNYNKNKVIYKVCNYASKHVEFQRDFKNPTTSDNFKEF